MKTRQTSSLPRLRRAAAVMAALGMMSCAKRPPVLVPPAAAIDAVAGFGSASVEGEEMALKGKFAFNFRLPDLGRIEAFDPFGRMIYYIVIGGGKAYLVLPSKRAYAEEPAERLMGRLLGLSLSPEEVIDLVGGQWSAKETGGGPPGAWTLERDGLGRVVHGGKNSFRFEAEEFFPGDGVPRAVRFSRDAASGRVKILSLVFNPPPQPEAFGTPFLGSFSRKSLEEILEMAR